MQGTWILVMRKDLNYSNVSMRRNDIKCKHVLKNLCQTHWGPVTHICICKLTIISSDNGLLHGRRQAFIWTNAGILLIAPLGTNFSEILIKIYIFSDTKMHLKMSAKWEPFCVCLNVQNIKGCMYSSHHILSVSEFQLKLERKITPSGTEIRIVQENWGLIQ